MLYFTFVIDSAKEMGGGDVFLHQAATNKGPEEISSLLNFLLCLHTTLVYHLYLMPVLYFNDSQVSVKWFSK